jgi:hypothetical protein
VRRGHPTAAGTGPLIFSKQFKLQHGILSFSGADIAPLDESR